MKQIFTNPLRAFMLAVSFLFVLSLSAVEVEIDGINYDIIAKAKQATVIAKSSGEYTGTVVIPESVEYEGVSYAVTSIGEQAFSRCGLTSVTIPNSVTSIGESAFWYCYGLTSVHISDIAAWCKIDFKDPYSNPLSYTEHLFLDGEEIKDLVIPNSVTSIGDYAFYECSGLTSVTIPNSVTSIGSSAFSGCSGLTSVTIPNSVTSIGEYAFYCSGLTSVTIGNSVTSIGEYAFYCSGLKEVHISDIAAWCNIDFSNYVSHVSNPLGNAHHLYLNGKEIKDLVIPEGVTAIKKYAFYGCSGLTSVTIPNSVTSIESGAFEDCSGLTSVTIPNSVTSIGEWAFRDCSGLTSVTIPNSVTSIENRVFNGCGGLTFVTIPNSVTSIGYEAFSGCSGLTSVTIPNSVKSIGSSAFGDCPELTDVYCYAEKVPSTESNAFEGSYVEYATLHVPDASIGDYKAKTPWSSFGKIVGLSGEGPEQPEQPEVEKCATPVVTYVDGCLEITCETEGAEFITDIADNDIKKHYESKIELSATYNIEVYATKAGYDNSDTVNVTLCWIDQDGADEENGIINVPSAPVLVKSNGGTLTLEGVPAGTDITVYTTSGTEIAKTIATGATTSVSVGLSKGTVVIVKIGNRSVKVRLR